MNVINQFKFTTFKHLLYLGEYNKAYEHMKKYDLEQYLPIDIIKYLEDCMYINDEIEVAFEYGSDTVSELNEYAYKNSKQNTINKYNGNYGTEFMYYL